MQNQTMTQRAALLIYRAYQRGGSWVVKLAMFYFGYKVLHHEVFETETAEPLLVVLGLWLCGIAPASFVDSLRRIGQAAEEEVERATAELPSKDATGTNESGA